jgi:hypothetical protein
MASSSSAQELPIQPALKIGTSAVYVGNPKQLVDLLASQVAQAVIEIHRTKGGMPLFKCKLRCKTLFPGNLDVYFLVDFPNIPLTVEKNIEGKDELILNLVPEKNPLVVDLPRANRFCSDLEEAIAFWSLCMETEVTKVYTDKNPKQYGRIVSEGIINMKINVFQGKEFIPSDFLQLCKGRKAFPAFKIAFGWVASTEDARSEDHMWGFKFDLSTFPQYTATRRVRSGAVSASDSVAGTKKKRKAELEADVVVDSAAVSVDTVVA